MNYSQLEKSKILAEYLNIDFEKLLFSEKLNWHNDWNNLMKVAIKLSEDTKYGYTAFNQYQLSFDQETLFQNCFDFVKEIEKWSK